MQELLYAIANYRKKEEPIWVIWGSGKRGLGLLEYIKQLKAKSVYFADNDIEKCNKIINGIQCLSAKDVEAIAGNSIILSSPYRDYELYNDLKDRFPYVIPDIILEILMYYPKANGFNQFMPLGHYYSLYPDMQDVDKRYDELCAKDEIKNIDFNIDIQYGFLEKMKELLPTVPKWTDHNNSLSNKYRYKTDSMSFGVPDATCLHLMLRILKPRRLIEVGSGWSSAVTLDTNEFYLDKQMDVSFIEPYPNVLYTVLKREEPCKIKNIGLEKVDLSYFEQLEKGDILFIDSTHVSKIGSDVNYLLFEILPHLKSGVYIHFHDIFYPFEYPYEWFKKDGYIWNELYMMRAFLMNNKQYKILFFFDYLVKKHANKINECLTMINPSGGSLWLEKL